MTSCNVGVIRRFAMRRDDVRRSVALTDRLGGTRARLDPITTALQLGFYVLFLVSVVQYVRYRGPLQLSVLAIFGSFAALFALTFLNTLQPDDRPDRAARAGGDPVRTAVPRRPADRPDPPVPRIVHRVVFLGAVIAWEGVVLVPPIAATIANEGLRTAVRTIGTLTAVLYFFVVEIAAAAWFARDSRRRFGVARIRLGSAAVATGCSAPRSSSPGWRASVGRRVRPRPADSTTVTRFLVLDRHDGLPRRIRAAAAGSAG